MDTPGASDQDHDPPYRTTTTSYKSGDFTPPSPAGAAADDNPGPSVVTSLSYGDGRFPVKTTNAVGHVQYIQYSAYDAHLGVVVQSTGPNGVYTCYGYDGLGWKTSETARCGSAHPLTTTMQRYKAADDSSKPLEKVVTLTKVPTSSTTNSSSWVFADALGRTVRTLARSFDGGFSEAETVYDSRGNVHLTSKPRKATEAPLWTTTDHDFLDRPSVVTQVVGVIDGVEATAGDRDITNVYTYNGSSITTQTQGEGNPRTRTEQKNGLGKVAAVTDPNGKMIYYSYDADGNLTSTHPLDPAATGLQIHYDLRGRKIGSVDPDLGSWSYTYDGYGDLISQTDANRKRTTLSYDQLGRVTSKTYDADGDNPSTAEWVYDSAGGAGLGKLAAVVSPEDPHLNSPCTVPNTTQTSGNRAGRWFTYNPFGDVSEAFECVDGETFSTQYEYDDFGRQQVVRYPEVNSSRFAVNYNYTRLGFLQYVSDAADDKVYWQVKAMSAQGQVTDEQTRNGVETVSTRNLSMGWLLTQSVTAHADGDNLIQGLKYKLDVFGNLQERTRSEPRDMADSVESFGYDALDRLTTADVTIGSTGYHAADSFHYDDAGNLTQKGGKTYSYTGCTTGGGPHAVCSVDGGTPFTYDANGNLTLGNDRTISYNGANKVSQINRASTAQGIGADVVKFAYGADGNRVVQSAGTIATGSTDFTEAARTVYVGLGDTGKSIYERTTKASTGGGTATEHVHFIYAGGTHGGNAFALRVVAETRSATGQASSFDSPVVKYNHFDHLGSVTAMSDEYGRVVGLAQGGVNATAFAYDAWGGRRNADGSAADALSLPLQVGHREYTGHETIPSVGLVNMNGRVYDPDLGRFLSPDPNVQFVANLQSYNHYTYAMNNPLRYTDPTGYFLGISTGTLTRIGMIGLGIAACLNPATCVAYAAGMAIYGAVSMYEAGASFGQIIAVTALNVGMSAMTADTGDSAAARITVGMVSSVITSGFTAVIMGRNSLGESLLSTLAWSAASSAAGLAVGNAVAASQRSAEEQGGAEGTEEVKAEYYAARRVAGYQTTVEPTFDEQIDAALGPMQGYTKQDDLDLLNLATRRQIAAEAADLAANNGSRYGQNSYYNSSAVAGQPKCNIYVRDVQDAAGATTPKFSANEWGNRYDKTIPNANWKVIPTVDAEPGDVIAYSHPGHGHVGIVTAVGPNPSALAAGFNGVIPNSHFWNPPPGAGAPVVWRWTGD